MLEIKRIPPTVSQKIGRRLVVEKKFVDQKGNTSSYTTIGHENSRSVATIAVTKDHKIIIARQFRPGPEKVMDELPGGGVENGEEYSEAARRELSEETGYKSDDSIVYLGDAYKDGYANGITHYFLLKNCYQECDTHNEEGEVTEPHEISITKLINNAKNAKMTDSIAILQAYDHLIELQKASDEN